MYLQYIFAYNVIINIHGIEQVRIYNYINLAFSSSSLLLPPPSIDMRSLFEQFTLVVKRDIYVYKTYAGADIGF